MMKMAKNANISMHRAEFKAKKRWWMWALAILVHIIAVRFWLSKVYIVPVVIFIIDLIVLPDLTHTSYAIDGKFLIIKNIFWPIYPSTEIALHTITAVDNATLMTFRGFGVHIYEEFMGAYRIVYSEGRGQKKSVIVAPKNRFDFMGALAAHVGSSVILLDNRESAFKKKRDTQ